MTGFVKEECFVAFPTDGQTSDSLNLADLLSGERQTLRSILMGGAKIQSSSREIIGFSAFQQSRCQF